MKRRPSKAATDTHIGHGLLVGAGIDQQPRTVRVTIRRGPNQRRASILRVGFKQSTTKIAFKARCYSIVNIIQMWQQCDGEQNFKLIKKAKQE